MTPATNEEATAYHQAGHAIVGAIRGRSPESVTIVRQGGTAGQTQFFDDCRPEFNRYLGGSPEKRDYIETRILIALAGTIAHDLRFPAHVRDSGDEYDEERARALIVENAVWADSCRDSYFRQLQETVRGVLQTNWPWVEAVARALIDDKTISGEELSRLRPSCDYPLGSKDLT
jgi:ATP-dependent Zn protease